MVRQVQTQEETEEKLRKRKFIILTGLRGDTPFRATRGNTRVVRRQSTGARAEFRPRPLLGFLWERQVSSGSTVYGWPV